MPARNSKFHSHAPSEEYTKGLQEREAKVNEYKDAELKKLREHVRQNVGDYLMIAQFKANDEARPELSKHLGKLNASKFLIERWKKELERARQGTFARVCSLGCARETAGKGFRHAGRAALPRHCCQDTQRQADQRTRRQHVYGRGSRLDSRRREALRDAFCRCR